MDLRMIGTIGLLLEMRKEVWEKRVRRFLSFAADAFLL